MIGERLSHYEILAKLGEGGMGVVYKARDVRLERTVALKFLPSRALEDDEARARFVREAKAAAALNHPNIATIYDVEIGDDTPFIAMEYVDGPTLREERNRRTALPPDEVVRIGIEIAEGLKAAHGQGITHRDVKSSNVMLSRGGRVKIMDFGLARIVGHDTITGTATTPGTIAYMSPEQLQGQGGDERSDIWALGVILYEIATGHLPFAGAADLAMVYRIIKQNPTPPTQLRIELPPALERVVARALEKNPRRRYPSADAMLADLRSLQASGTVLPRSGVVALTRRALEWPIRRPIVTVASLAVVLATALAATLALRARDRGVTDSTGAFDLAFTATVEPRRSVAVLGFKNLTGSDDVAWISTALAEMLTTELAAAHALRAIPGEMVARMSADLRIPDEASFGEETLGAIGDYLGADLVVTGSFLALEEPGGLRLDIRVQDASAGSTLAAVAETGARDSLFEVVARAGLRLRNELGVAAEMGRTVSALELTWPVNLEAARLYAEGLDRLRRLEAPAARGLLERSIAEDPRFPLAHAALAEAWTILGYDVRARESAQRASQLSGNLPEGPRMLIEAQYRETMGEWDDATAIYGGLWAAHPDNYEYGLDLLDAQIRAGDVNTASATVDALHALPAPAAHDARIDIAEAFVAEGLAQYDRQRAASVTARQKASEQGALVLVGTSWHMEGRSLFYMNQLEAALAAFQEGRRIFEHAQNRAESANALNAIGILHRVRGERTDALAYFDSALSMKRELGEQSGIAMVLGNMGIVHETMGNLERARDLQEQAVQINRDIGATTNVLGTLINLGNVTKRLGDFARARALYQEVVDGAERLNLKQTHALALNNLSGVLHHMGDLHQARDTRERAIQLLREIDQRRTLSYAFHGLGEILRDEGDLAGARAMHDSALAIRQDLKLGEVAGSRNAIARVMLEQEDFAGAEAWLQGSVAERADGMTPGDSAQATVLLAVAVAGLGRGDEAGRLAQEAARSIASAGGLEAQLDVNVLAADGYVAAGRATAARELLRSTLRDATRTGYVPIQLEARLRLGRLDLASGNVSARVELEALSRDASRQGFGLIARRASQLLESRVGAADVR